MIDETMISEVGRRLSRAAPPNSRVVLFGSHARGDATGRSDLDLLVIESEVDNAASEAVRLRRSLDGLRVPVDLVVVERALARRREKVAGTMVERALREGRVLADT